MSNGALSDVCPSCGAAVGERCRSYKLYVMEGGVRRDLGEVFSLKEAEVTIVGSINYDEVEVFAWELPNGPLWRFGVHPRHESALKPDWWRVP